MMPSAGNGFLSVCEYAPPMAMKMPTTSDTTAIQFQPLAYR